MSSSHNIEPKLIAKFDYQEKEELNRFNKIIENPSSSRIEKQIAEAKINSMEESKLPAPHNHKNRLHDTELEETGRKDNNLFHNDEAFQRYEMGNDQPHGSARGSKVLNQDQASEDYASTKLNHKARGVTKEKKQDHLFQDRS